MLQCYQKDKSSPKPKWKTNRQGRGTAFMTEHYDIAGYARISVDEELVRDNVSI